MTATRIGLATLTAAWLLSAALLWQTDVPALEVEADASAFASLDLDRHDRHDAVLRVLSVASLAAQLLALLAFAARPPRVRGPELVRAAQLGALAAVVLLAARLPFAAAGLWWQRRHEVAQLGYGRWAVDLVGPLAARAALLAAAAALFVALARRAHGRWWIAAAPAVAALGAAVVLAQPLVSPRLEPVPERSVVAEVERLAAEQGLDHPEVELRRTANRTRQLNAEAIGIGPTTRVILWGTTLELTPGERGFLVAHELAHVSRAHVWKGLAWFVLLVVPGLALLARVAPLESAGGVPRAALAAFVLLLVATPLVSTITRRYEREADWVALETTRDPEGARRLLVLIAERGVRDPTPPLAWNRVFGTHAGLAERVGLVDAWAASRGDRSRAGS